MEYLIINTSWPSNAIWLPRSGSTLAQVINEARWHLDENHITENILDITQFKVFHDLKIPPHTPGTNSAGEGLVSIASILLKTVPVIMDPHCIFRVGSAMQTTPFLNSSPMDKMVVFSRTIFSDAFSWRKSFIFWFLLSRKFDPKVPIDNNSALVQIMASRRIVYRPLFEPMPTWFTNAYMRR